jgi:hypothetical protein
VLAEKPPPTTRQDGGHGGVSDHRQPEAVIRTHTPAGQPLFLCGIAMNQRDMLDLFEAVFLLSLDVTAGWSGG